MHLLVAKIYGGEDEREAMIYSNIYHSNCLWEWWLAKASSSCLAHSTRRGPLLTPSSTCAPKKDITHGHTNADSCPYTSAMHPLHDRHVM